MRNLHLLTMNSQTVFKCKRYQHAMHVIVNWHPRVHPTGVLKGDDVMGKAELSKEVDYFLATP